MECAARTSRLAICAVVLAAVTTAARAQTSAPTEMAPPIELNPAEGQPKGSLPKESEAGKTGEAGDKAKSEKPPAVAGWENGFSDLALSRSEEHTSELQSHSDLVCRLLLEKKKSKTRRQTPPS